MKSADNLKCYKKALTDQNIREKNLREGLDGLENDFVKKIVLCSVIATCSLFGLINLINFINQTGVLETYQILMMVGLLVLFSSYCIMIIEVISDFNRNQKMRKILKLLNVEIKKSQISVHDLTTAGRVSLSSECTVNVSEVLRMEKFIEKYGKSGFVSKAVPDENTFSSFIDRFDYWENRETEANFEISEIEAEGEHQYEECKTIAEDLILGVYFTTARMGTKNINSFDFSVEYELIGSKSLVLIHQSTIIDNFKLNDAGDMTRADQQCDDGALGYGIPKIWIKCY